MRLVVLPTKMKVKLVILNKTSANEYTNDIHYFITSGHISSWRYSTDNGIKNIYTEFDE